MYAPPVFWLFALERIEDVGNGNAHAPQPVGVNRNFVLLQQAAKAAHIGHAGRTQQPTPDGPVLNRTQVGKRVFLLVAFFGYDRVLKNLAEARRDGGHRGRTHTGWNLADHVLQPLGNLLAGPVTRL